MERYGVVKWTDNKDSFTRNKGCVTRASETKSQYFIIDEKKLKEISIPIDSEIFVSKN